MSSLDSRNIESLRQGAVNAERRIGEQQERIVHLELAVAALSSRMEELERATKTQQARAIGRGPTVL